MQLKSISELDKFLNRCDELINSKFILAETKISELLNSIADSEMLYHLFEKLTKDFDYNAYKNVSLSISKDNENRGVILLPESTGDRLSFIFCLLIELDNKQIEINKFLQTFFYEDGSYFESYYAFCNQIIKPFKIMVKAAVDELYSDEHYAREKSNTFVGKIQTEKFKEIELLLSDDKEKILSDNNLNDEEKAETINLLEGFLSSLLTFDKTQIKLLFTGYKYLCKAQKKLLVNFLKIEKILNENG